MFNDMKVIATTMDDSFLESLIKFQNARSLDILVDNCSKVWFKRIQIDLNFLLS